MRSSQVNAGDTGTIGQYNNLRDDAKASSWLLPHQQSTPNLTVYVEAGVYYFNNTRYEFAGGNSPSFTAPSTNPRIDILSINSSGTLVRTAGAENASPVAPQLPADNFPICQIYNRVSQTQIYDTDQGAGKGYIYKDIRQTMTALKPVFGGTGADGGLVITSGTTTVDCAGARIKILNYNSISITGSGKLGFINPHANGTVIVIKCKNDCTLTSSSAPMIDASGMGAAGSATSVQASSGSNNWGGAGNDGLTYSNIQTKAANQQTGGATGELATNVMGGISAIPHSILAKYSKLFVGAGGASGNASFVSGTGLVTGGTAGRGGGGLIIEVAGAVNFTTANGISVNGQNGGNGSITGGTPFAHAGGGGGGGGGFIIFLYNILTSFSGSMTATGGIGGNAKLNSSANGTGGGGGGSATNAGNSGTNTTTDGAKNGADGGAGLTYNDLNTEFY